MGPEDASTTSFEPAESRNDPSHRFRSSTVEDLVEETATPTQTASDPEPDPFAAFDREAEMREAAQEPAATGPEPKTCRICFDTDTIDIDPELGRLLSPCRCRGSSKYVHEKCLNDWRSMSANPQSFYECPTCHYRYKFSRLQISQWVGSRVFQLAVTILIMFLTVFVLGFIADPIINFYITAYAYIYRDSGLGYIPRSSGDPAPILIPVAPNTMAEHMLKGFTSLGLLGFVKVIFMFGPQGILNMRGTVRTGAARPGGGTARDRLGNLGWIMVVVGVLNFFWWVWKFVSKLTRTWLNWASEEILDVADEEL